MDVGAFREFCLSFPNATEHLQWESLVFKVGGRIFAILALEPARVWLTLKTSPESFLELTERPGIIPAPYLARAKWIALEARDAVPPAELRHLVRTSYDLVLAKLPRKARAALSSSRTAKRSPSRRKHALAKSRPAKIKRTPR
jgi:predicted DNA-binding protein (MmcQ/YjbR family)